MDENDNNYECYINSLSFWRTCYLGDLNQAELSILEYHGRLIDLKFKFGIEKDTPLSISVRRNNLEITRMLLVHYQQFENSRYLLNDDNNLFLIACKNDNKDMLKLLLDYRLFDINESRFREETALGYACKENKTELVELLLKYQNLDVNRRELSSPLSLACTNGNKEIVEMLLKHPKIDINITDVDYSTPFYNACANGHLNIARMLDSHGSIVHSDRDEYDIIFLAFEKEDFPLFDFLTSELDLMSKIKRSTMMRIFGYEKNLFTKTRLKIINKIMKSEKTDLNRFGLYKSSLLYEAIKNENVPLMEEFSKVRNFKYKLEEHYPVVLKGTEPHFLHLKLFLSCEIDFNVNTFDENYIYLYQHDTLDLPIYERCRKLLGGYTTDRVKIRFDLRKELGYSQKDSSRVFAIVNLIKSGFFKLNSHIRSGKKYNFIEITKKIPNEIIMKICDIIYSNKEFISQQIIDDGIQHVLSYYDF